MASHREWLLFFVVIPTKNIDDNAVQMIANTIKPPAIARDGAPCVIKSAK